ncbi:hypothetical protein PFICI_03142 [Pestalotiopsis fici W106-1]|uniref:Uncharacterized protein n=1 Tax=Pestalotiopsis fici (strain W106-1 / CGMCC3.15140) TaxID=1229662 RepID=W3XI46_PESFW|nr:uncharacterized protein PFICI_03142 [Pestalotiopsis fici W106-1]ETS85117.1 hypothetical protein PFICI_03142 [Pestalotiopsis fici W106-1]
MPSTPSRSGSGDSAKSAGGSTRDRELSVNFYSPENGHWAAYVRTKGADDGTMYHVRSDAQKDQDQFYYDEKRQVFHSPSLYGSSVVGKLSSGEAAMAGASIRSYASDERNIPRVSRGTNCQNFVGGALGRLEQDGLLKTGQSQYFSQQVGRRGEDIGKDLQRTGRHFALAQKIKPQGPPAARFAEQETRRAPKKLNMSAYSHLSQ